VDHRMAFFKFNLFKMVTKKMKSGGNDLQF
jgi:hypothetical protein